MLVALRGMPARVRLVSRAGGQGSAREVETAATVSAKMSRGVPEEGIAGEGREPAADYASEAMLHACCIAKYPGMSGAEMPLFEQSSNSGIAIIPNAGAGLAH